MDFKTKYKYFLDFLIPLAFISLNIIYQSTHAKDLFDLSELSKTSVVETNNYIFGADGLYTHVTPKSDYGKIFRIIKPGTNFYIGYNWESIMLEIGYLSTTRKSKTTMLATGSEFISQTTTQPTLINGQVRFRNTHLDLNFFTNFYEKINIVTAVGIGFIRPKVTFRATDLISNKIPYQGITTKTSAVFRVGVGLAYFLNNNASIRTMGYFDQYSRIRFREPKEPDNKAFKNAYTVLVGLFFKV